MIGIDTLDGYSELSRGWFEIYNGVWRAKERAMSMTINWFSFATLLALLAFAGTLGAAESEPNDSAATADALASPEGDFSATLATENVDWFVLEVSGPAVVAIRAVTESPVEFVLGLGTSSENAEPAKHVLRTNGEGYREAVVFVPDVDASLFICVVRGETDTWEEYAGFEDTIDYDLVYRIDEGSGDAPGLDVDTNVESAENEQTSFEPIGEANSGGVLRYRSIATVWEANAATLDDESGEFEWVPGYNDAGERQLVLIVTEYPSLFPADNVGLSTFALIDFNIADLNRVPVVSDREDISLDYGVLLTSSFTVVDEDGDDLEVTVLLDDLALPASAQWSGSCFSWKTEVEDVGEHVLQITAAEEGNPSAYCVVEVEIEVTEPDGNDAPIVRGVGCYEGGEPGSPNWTFHGIFEDADAGATALWWQVQIATLSNFDTLVWDSGELLSSDIPAVFGDEVRCVYSSALSWDTVHYWRIRVCDENESESAWVSGSSFTTQVEPPAGEREMPELVIGAASGEPETLPYQQGGVVSTGVEFTALFNLAEGDTLQLRFVFDDDEPIFYALWQVTEGSYGILRYQNFRDDEDIERRAAILVPADALYVLHAYLYDEESEGESNFNVYAAMAPRLPSTDNEKRLGELDDQTPEGVDPTPPASIEDPAYGSTPSWREPAEPPPESSPPDSDCVWRVNIEYWDEILEDINEPTRLYVRSPTGEYEPVQDAHSPGGDLLRIEDVLQTKRHALGGFAYTMASVRAHRANSGYRYKDGADLSEDLTAKAKRVEGHWMLTATWLGDCGKPIVSVHAYSVLAADLSVKATWDEGFASGEAEYVDIKSFKLASASSRSILCPAVNVDVRTRMAFGVEKAAESEVFQLPAISGDLIGDGITATNAVLEHIQEEWNNSEEWLYLSADPSTDGSPGWWDDLGEASVSTANVKIRATSGSAVTLARPKTAPGGGGPPYNEYNRAWINSRTSEMIAAISLVCESDETDDCVGDIIRLLYEIGPIPGEGKDADNHTQDVHIEANPNDPGKSASITDTPKPLGQDEPQGDGPRKSSTTVEIAGENVD